MLIPANPTIITNTTNITPERTHDMTENFTEKVAAMLAAEEAAERATVAADAAKRDRSQARKDMLDSLGWTISQSIPGIDCESLYNDNEILIESTRGLYDDEHGWRKARIEVEVTPRYGTRFILTSFTPRRGEDFGPSITTNDIDRLIATLRLYVPSVES